MPRAVALFSGGLDSILAVRIMQEQGFDVDALNIRTVFSCCQATAAQTAVELGARLTVLPVGDDYLEVIRNPRYGYGRGVNACVDCRIYMCRTAGEFMRQVDACVVVTGEVVGQRPMSQKKQQLRTIAARSGLDGRLLRPLSAKLLPPTIVEQEGIVDREQLYDFNGRGRRGLRALADRFGLGEMPTPSTGCAMTEPLFAPRVRDLMQHCIKAGRWDFELLNFGRHFRLDEATKVVVGRNAADNAALRQFAAREDASAAWLLVPENFRGPEALVIGERTDAAVAAAGTLMVRYSGHGLPSPPRVRVTGETRRRVVDVSPWGDWDSIESL